MNRWLVALPLLILSVSPVFGENADLNAKLQKMASSTDASSYQVARDRIVDEAKSKTKELRRIANNREEDWRVRLAAGICLERILRGKEIDGLDHRDWRTDPEYRSDWDTGRMADGTSRSFTPVFFKRLEEAGLWFHYLEFCDGRIGTEDLDPTFRLVPVFVQDRSSGGIRQLAARIADAKVVEAFKAGASPDSMDWTAFLAFVSDGTFPDGAKHVLMTTKSGDSFSPRTMLLLTDAISDVDFLSELGQRYLPDENNGRIINRRLSRIKTNPTSDIPVTPTFDLRPFLPVSTSFYEDSSVPSSEKDESTDSDAVRKHGQESFFIVFSCIVLGVSIGILRMARKSNKHRSGVDLNRNRNDNA